MSISKARLAAVAMTKSKRTGFFEAYQCPKCQFFHVGHERGTTRVLNDMLKMAEKRD